MILDPKEIEKKSMEIIDGRLHDMGLKLPFEYEHIVRRVIHTTADFDFAKNMCFVGEVSKVSLKNALIITDTNMTLAGISKPGIGRLSARADCYMAKEAVASEAKALGVTRAVVSVRHAIRENKEAAEGSMVYSVGNAPTALFELCDLIEKGFRPRLVIATPVGFVNVTEAKEAMAECCRIHDIPCIVAYGNKGGSTVAAAIINAMIYKEIESNGS